jgi:hypothetical protein
MTQIKLKKFKLLFFLLIVTGSSFVNGQPANPRGARTDNGGFLFVTFKGGSTALGEQIYFGLSRDGIHWEALKDGEPVLTSTLGEKGVRDPYLLRSPDDKKFYLLATDLSTHLNPGWKRASQAGSRAIMIWESDDLVKWSEPRLVTVAAADAGCAWAPEAIYDEESQDYLVFWSSTTKSDNFEKQRIWAAITKDFRSFSEPFIYLERSGQVIDATIVRSDGKYYRFAKDETGKAITMESADKLMGPWKEMPEFSLAKMKGYEGPEIFQLGPLFAGQPARWGLLLDHYEKGEGYKLFQTHDLTGGQFAPAIEITFPFKFRHGFPLRITDEEYKRLKAAY